MRYRCSKLSSWMKLAKTNLGVGSCPTSKKGRKILWFIRKEVWGVDKLLAWFYSNTYPRAGGGADWRFRRLKSSNLCASATCGHECSSKISCSRSSVLLKFLLFFIGVFTDNTWKKIKFFLTFFNHRGGPPRAVRDQNCQSGQTWGLRGGFRPNTGAT